MLCSCQYGSFEKQGDGRDSNSTVFHIAVLPITECQPFTVAQECGLFDSIGITISLDTFYAAMDADTAFMNGDVQMLVADSLKAIYLNRLIQGDSISTVMTDSLHLSLLTSSQSRIIKTTSLKEKIVAVTRNSIIDYLADRTMKQAKLQPEELNRPQINNIPLRAHMLTLNQYDGAILPEPYATECKENGANRIARFNEQQFRLLVKNSTLKANRKIVDDIISAYQKAKKKTIETKVNDNRKDGE